MRPTRPPTPRRDRYARTLAATTILAWGAPAEAQHLDLAFQRTLATDPQIRAARAGIDIAEADIAIARAAGRPDLSAEGHAVVQVVDTYRARRNGGGVGGALAFTLPVFTGGEVAGRVRSARAARDAEVATYDDVVNGRLADTAARYADVARDRVVEGINVEQVAIVGQELTAARERARHGDLTDTDVNQAAARLAVAKGRLAQARAALTTSAESLREVTGDYLPAAVEVAPPPVPADVADDLSTAPAMRAAAARIVAAQADIAVARSQRLPRLSLASRYSHANDLDPNQTLLAPQFRSNWTIGLTLNVPVFQGGVVGARVRRAQQLAAVRIEERTAIERELRATVRSQYAELRAADAAVEDIRRAVEASRAAREGVRIGSQIGERTFLDILNADQEILQAETRLAGARRDRLALAYSILALMGRMQALTRAEAVPKQAAAYPVDKAGLWVWRGSATWSLMPGKPGDA